MSTSIFIAKILGPVCLIAGVGLMLNKELFERMIEEYTKNIFLIFFGGIIAIIIGLTIVLSHNIWVFNWRVLITIYGWGGIIKGTWLLLFPKTVTKVMQVYQKNKSLTTLHFILVIVIGTSLTIFGYLK